MRAVFVGYSRCFTFGIRPIECQWKKQHILSNSSRVIAATLISAILSGCNPTSSPQPIEPTSKHVDESHHEAILQEFTEIAEGFEQSENAYLGRRQVKRLQAELQQSKFPKNIGLTIQLSGELLRLGESDEAVEQIDQAFAMLHSRKLMPSIAMHKARAMVYLRHAEVINCINRHNDECCIFPIRGRGVHHDQSAAREAKHSLMTVLNEEPDNLLVQWLLNIACMALSEYPDAVPLRFRIPAETLDLTSDNNRFVDVAPKLGIDTFNLCGGVIVEDFNGDDLLDIVTSTYDPRGPLAFYRNAGDGTFTDETKAAGLDNQLGGLNCIGADYDNDGDMDVLVLRGAWLTDDGRIRNSLIRNNGDGTFSDVTSAAGLAAPAYPTQCATWGDYDNDGDLDLFVGNESRMGLPNPSGDYPCQLFRNNGDGTFTDIAANAGVTNDRYTKGVAAGDYDNDGDLDIYVSNGGKNRLYRNDGNGTFTDVAEELSVTHPEGRSFACWFFDYNNDGWLDLFVTGYSARPADLLADYRGQAHRAVLPCLYENQRDGTFKNVTDRVGLDHVYLPMGANFGDIDNDGYLDICLATGDPEFETLMPNVMLRNEEGNHFRDVTFVNGFGHLQKGHGVAFADFDHDGDQDIYNQLGGFYPGDAYHNAMFINPGNDNHHLTLQLRGTQSNRSGIGCRITVETSMPASRNPGATASSTKTLHRAVGAVSSFGGSPFRQEIGLGKSTSIVRLTVEWPTSGIVQQFTEVPVDRMIRITEGQPDLEIVPRKRFEFSE